MDNVQSATSIASFQSSIKCKADKIAYPVVSSHSADTTNGIGQTSMAYTLIKSVDNVEVKEVNQSPNEHEQAKVLHTVPVMTDTERDATKKRIGNDLYEIFMRIQAELNLDSELYKK